MSPEVSDIDFLRSRNTLRPVNPPPRLISEFIEGRRIMPASSPVPGPWRNALTPYLVEIMDDLSPYSPVQEEAIIKGHQIGLTAAAENVIGYFMDAAPADILFVSATEDLLEEWSARRLEPLIDSLGFRHKIAAQTANPRRRRTGDRTLSKEFPGGSLKMASAQAAASLRSGSRRVILFDEVDGAPAELRTGEGNYLDVASARASAWGHRKKLFIFSTPTTWADSLIFKRYELGDCRKYLIPCPLCGKEQEMIMATEGGNHGLKGDWAAGQLARAYYLCDHCHDAFFNYHKTAMLARGRWVAEKQSSSPYLVSRHLSSLYSPAGFLSWEEVVQKWANARGDPEAEKSFRNLYQGLPYRESGSRPELRAVVQLRGGYREGQLQPGVLFLTAGIDVQRGSDRDPATGKLRDPDNPPRLEMEVLGHGKDRRTWSILYRAFEGEIGDPYAGAWEELNTWAAGSDEWGTGSGLIFRRADGFRLTVLLVLIDSGDGMYTDVVYRFCERWRNTYPSKGFGFVRANAKRKERGDIPGPGNYRRYRPVRVGSSDRPLYELSTNYYKTFLYNLLRIKREVADPQRPGYQDFPYTRGDEYFQQITAEEMRSDGSFHKIRQRNEALDCRVMAAAAGDIALQAMVLDYRAAGRQRGATPPQLAAVDAKWVLARLEAVAAPRTIGEPAPAEQEGIQTWPNL